jgi:hypothetical protein
VAAAAHWAEVAEAGGVAEVVVAAAGGVAPWSFRSSSWWPVAPPAAAGRGTGNTSADTADRAGTAGMGRSPGRAGTAEKAGTGDWEGKTCVQLLAGFWRDQSAGLLGRVGWRAALRVRSFVVAVAGLAVPVARFGVADLSQPLINPGDCVL